MWDRSIEPTPFPNRPRTEPAADPEYLTGVGPESNQCSGYILTKTPFLNGGYTYFAVAILTDMADGTAAQVFEYSGPGSKTSLSLCKPGSHVIVSIQRNGRNGNWFVTDVEIVYDVESERAALDKLKS